MLAKQLREIAFAESAGCGNHAQHDNPATADARAHAVSFAGALQQALRDVSSWVERGTRPADTQYQVIDSQINLPADVTARGGIQPVIELRANGGVRANVKVNQPVTFTASIEVPPNAGKVVGAEWDFEGAGDYPMVERLDAPQASVSLSRTHSYPRPGTYFAVLRAASNRDGDLNTAYARIQNIARVRIIVE